MPFYFRPANELIKMVQKNMLPCLKSPPRTLCIVLQGRWSTGQPSLNARLSVFLGPQFSIPKPRLECYHDSQAFANKRSVLARARHAGGDWFDSASAARGHPRLLDFSHCSIVRRSRKAGTGWKQHGKWHFASS